jgi:hypothetical protein
LDKVDVVYCLDALFFAVDAAIGGVVVAFELFKSDFRFLLPAGVF